MTAHVAVFSFENYFGKITQKFPAAIYEYLQMAPTSVKDFSYNFNSYNSPLPPPTHTQADTKSENVYPCSAQSQSRQHRKHRQHKMFATVAAFYYLCTCISQIRTRTHLWINVCIYKNVQAISNFCPYFTIYCACQLPAGRLAVSRAGRVGSRGKCKGVSI